MTTFILTPFSTSPTTVLLILMPIFIHSRLMIFDQALTLTVTHWSTIPTLSSDLICWSFCCCYCHWLSIIRWVLLIWHYCVIHLLIFIDPHLLLKVTDTFSDDSVTVIIRCPGVVVIHSVFVLLMIDVVGDRSTGDDPVMSIRLLLTDYWRPTILNVTDPSTNDLLVFIDRYSADDPIDIIDDQPILLSVLLLLLMT